jgi:hypothetical protein
MIVCPRFSRMWERMRSASAPWKALPQAAFDALQVLVERVFIAHASGSVRIIIPVGRRASYLHEVMVIALASSTG